MDQSKQEKEYGYELFPERNTGPKEEKSFVKSLFTSQFKCVIMLKLAMETSECFSKLVSCQQGQLNDVLSV